jgi:uncharacterized protein YneF (UPF0154 family)
MTLSNINPLIQVAAAFVIFLVGFMALLLSVIIGLLIARGIYAAAIWCWPRVSDALAWISERVRPVAQQRGSALLSWWSRHVTQGS